jgi:hypothetical protein
MTIQNRNRYVAALLGVVLTSPSYAYLDPGTGSIILQSTLAGIAVAMGMLRFYWDQFKAFLANLVGSSAEGQRDHAKKFETDSDTKNES